MKRYSILCIACTAIILVCLSGCSEEYAATSLRLSLSSLLESRGSKTLVPDGESLVIHSYSLEGSGPNGNTFSITTLSPQVLIEGLVFGTWEIQAVGRNEQGTDLVTGSVTHHLTTTSTQAELFLDTLVGSGTLDVTFSWGDPNFPSITLDVYVQPQGESETKITSGIVMNGSTATARYETVKASGSYALRYELFSNGIKIAGGTEAVRIIENSTTIGTISISIDSESSTTQGLAIVNTTATPIEGTISGIETTILPNTPVTAVFNHIKGGGTTDIAVQWFLDGSLIGTGLSVTFSTFTGQHRLDAFASSDKAGSMGSATLPFSASVTGNNGVPVMLDTVRNGELDRLGQSFALQDVSDCIFLRDGRILVASAHTLQLYEVVRDSLKIVKTFSGGAAGTNPGSALYHTYGVTDLAVDLFEDIVVTTSSTDHTLVAYAYDSEQADLTMIDWRQSDDSGDEWWNSMGNPELDPINNYLYFIDHVDNVIFYYSYSDTALSCIGISNLDSASATVGLASPQELIVSPTGECSAFVCPAINTFHVLSNALLSIPPNPQSTVQFSASNESGNIHSIKIFSNDLYLLRDDGIVHYHKGSDLNHWTQTTTIGDPLNGVTDMAFSTDMSSAWIISSSNQPGISLLTIISGVPNHDSFVSTSDFSGRKIAISPSEDFLFVTGSDDDVMLMRIADH